MEIDGNGNKWKAHFFIDTRRKLSYITFICFKIIVA